MKFYTVEYQGNEYAAVSRDGEKLYLIKGTDLNGLIVSGSLEDPEQLIKDQTEAGNVIEAGIADVRLLAPIPHPLQDVVCLGLNYAAHSAEAARFSYAFASERPLPVFFSKRVNTAPGPGDEIPSYRGLVESLDYETELAVVLGKDAFQVKAADAGQYVLGYTILNDVTARKIQTGHKQWYFGKSLDGFCPMGPCIVSRDTFDFPPKTGIRCTINDEKRQDSDTGLLLYGIPEIIEILTRGMTLQAGTIIATGTPAGVGMGLVPPTFLKPGDKIHMEIDGIGVLENTIGK